MIEPFLVEVATSRGLYNQWCNWELPSPRPMETNSLIETTKFDTIQSVQLRILSQHGNIVFV